MARPDRLGDVAQALVGQAVGDEVLDHRVEQALLADRPRMYQMVHFRRRPSGWRMYQMVHVERRTTGGRSWQSR